jgi:anti-sigma B factor antagonist
MDFDLTTEELGDGLAKVTVGGEVDLLAAPAVRQTLLAAIEKGARGIVVDLTTTDFIDSTTLGVLVGANKRLLQQGSALAIVCDNPNIRTIFEITLLDRVFDIFSTVDDAVAHVRAFEHDGAAGAPA